jgi:hypothetical protein
MIHDCEQFDMWLDSGRDASLSPSANAHAAGCARCAGALELEALLAEAPSVRAGAAFTEGVLYRVRDAERARAASRLVLADTASPWWLRAPAEPASALALMAAALLAWRGDGLWSLALQLSSSARAHDWTRGPGSVVLDVIGNAFSGVASGTLAPGTLASAALLTVVLAVLGISSWALYHAIERLVGNAGSRPLPAPQHAVPHAR